MIADYLFKGRENTQTAKALAERLNCEKRKIVAAISRERNQGLPIIGITGGSNPGYYLAGYADELKEYCDKLHQRASRIYKTRRALLETAKTLPAGSEP